MARALHAKRRTKKGSTDVVGIHNLRVLLLQEDGTWFAQGAEIDYVAQGRTISEVKRNFERGLAETIDLHLEDTGSITGLLRWAPPEVLADFIGAGQEKTLGFSVVVIKTRKAKSATRKSPKRKIAAAPRVALPFGSIKIQYTRPESRAA